MKVNVARWTLDERITALVDRLGRFPESTFFDRNTYFAELKREAERDGTLQQVFERIGGNDYFQAASVKIPSFRQKLIGATIAQDGFEHERKKLEMSIPGSQKTGAVLTAIDIINREYMPRLEAGKRVKTLYAFPSGLVGTMMGEIQRFLPNYKTVCITRKTRDEDIQRAADPAIDIVLVGYEMSFRKVGLNGKSKEQAGDIGRTFALMADLPSVKKAYEYIANLAGEEKVEQLKRGKLSWTELIQFIINEENKDQSATVMEALHNRVFSPETPYYVILGEAHNLVNDRSKTAQAFADMFREARWGVLETGTAVRNNIEQMAYLAYILGAVDAPDDFPRLVRTDPKRVRALLKPYILEPAIKELGQLDADVPTLRDSINEAINPGAYIPSDATIETNIALLNSPLFTAPERLYLARILLAHPRALHPDRFDLETKKPMYQKVHDFFEQHPALLEALEKTPSERAAKARQLIDEAVSQGEKTLVFCEHNITDLLEREFQGYNYRVISQAVSTEAAEDGISDRHLALLEAAVNPDVQVVIATRGTLREGFDAREFTRVINYEESSLDFRVQQANARAHRAGQRRSVRIDTLRAEGIETENAIAAYRKWKSHLAKQVYEGNDPTQEEIGEYIANISAERSQQLRPLLELSSRGQVALIFSSLVGVGSKRFIEVMSASKNAMVLSKHFNFEWDYTYSANCARLLAEKVIPEIERKRGLKLENILEGASGPSTIARTLKRPTTSIDVLRLQLNYGILACEEASIQGAQHYLGSIDNLTEIIPVNSVSDEVFQKGKEYTGKNAIKEGSMDLYICALGIYYLNGEERKQFFREAHRVLGDKKSLILSFPRSKIAHEYEEQLLQNIETYGFTIDTTLTGEYGARHAEDVDKQREVEKDAFNPYVVVATKEGPENKEAQQGTQFVFYPGYKVVEGRIADKDIEKAIEEGKRPRVYYGDFYLRNRTRTSQAESEIEREMRDVQRTYGQDAVKDALERLSGVLSDES